MPLSKKRKRKKGSTVKFNQWGRNQPASAEQRSPKLVSMNNTLDFLKQEEARLIAEQARKENNQ